MDLNYIVKIHVGCFRLLIPYGQVVFQANTRTKPARVGPGEAPAGLLSIAHGAFRLDISPCEMGNKGTAPSVLPLSAQSKHYMVRDEGITYGIPYTPSLWDPYTPTLLRAVQAAGGDAESCGLILQPWADSFVFTTSCFPTISSRLKRVINN